MGRCQRGPRGGHRADTATHLAVGASRSSRAEGGSPAGPPVLAYTPSTIGRTSSMRAAVFRQGDIVVDSIPDPRPSRGPGAGAYARLRHLRIRPARRETHAAVRRPARRAGGRWVMDPTRDVVFGHEFCCEVVDYGPGTDKRAAQTRHPGLLAADDAGRQHCAGHRLFQRDRRRLRPIHAAGGTSAAAGAERPARRPRRTDRADRGGLARRATRAPDAARTCRW